MYHYPRKRYFSPQEFFPKSTIAAHTGDDEEINSSIWRLLDWRIIWTVNQFRERFGTMIINDYMWGGKNQYRGYRPAIDLIDFDKSNLLKKESIVASWSSFTSQHCFGRAIDCKFKWFTAEEVRQDIKRNPKESRYKYITAIEDNVDWLHFDCRNWDKGSSGILFFNP